MINPVQINPLTLPCVELGNLRQLPEEPCIYFAIDNQNKIQYIGKAKNVNRRWRTHHRYHQLKAIGEIRIAYLYISDETLLDSIESVLIDYFQPILNETFIPTSNKWRTSNQRRIRITRSFRLDSALLDGLNDLAKRRNSSSNRLLENILYDFLKTEGAIDPNIEPLGETRGRD